MKVVCFQCKLKSEQLISVLDITTLYNIEYNHH